MWVNIEPDERKFINTCPGLLMLSARLAIQDKLRLDYEGSIECARSNYAEPSNDDIEIDDEPAIAHGADGVWVMMWGWVANNFDTD